MEYYTTTKNGIVYVKLRKVSRVNHDEKKRKVYNHEWDIHTHTWTHMYKTKETE